MKEGAWPTKHQSEKKCVLSPAAATFKKDPVGPSPALAHGSPGIPGDPHGKAS